MTIEGDKTTGTNTTSGAEAIDSEVAMSTEPESITAVPIRDDNDSIYFLMMGPGRNHHRKHLNLSPRPLDNSVDDANSKPGLSLEELLFFLFLSLLYHFC